tara:strand:+ start:208 stop:474 length:267 start_codon:yes stop_codon:yes gene_type:complete
MCIFRQKMPEPTNMGSMKPAESRVNPGASSPLPTKKELVDPDEIQGIQYGDQRKKQTPAAGKKVGTGALRIPLNVGGGAGGGTGGANV